MAGRLRSYLTITYVLAIVSLQFANPALGQKTEDALEFRASVVRDDLQGANRFAMSADGRFLYVAPWRGQAIVMFRRNEGHRTSSPIAATFWRWLCANLSDNAIAFL